MTVDTKTAPHRELRFETFEEILAELDRVDAAVRDSRAATTGNWSVGEIADHCAKFLRFACDGFPSRAPAPVRWIARALLFKKALGPEPFPTGFKLPKQAAALLPDPGIPDADGIDALRKELKRVLAGKTMDHPSPLMGPLTHDQWIVLQCKHCAMHMGFITLDAAPSN